MPQSFIVKPVVLKGLSTPDPEDRDGEHDKVPIKQEERVSDPLHHLDIQKSVRPDVIHPRVLRELMEVYTKPLSIISSLGWLGRFHWLDIVTFIYKKSRKEDPGSYKPVNLASVLRSRTS